MKFFKAKKEKPDKFEKTKAKEPQIKAVKTRLQCRSGLNLAMKLTEEEHPKLHLCGVKSDGPETIFYLIPVGLRQVAIQQVETQCYIGMNASGKLFPAETYTNECKFKENVYENYWCIYSSVQYKTVNPDKQRPWHIGINDIGKAVRGSKAKKDKEVSHFLPQPIEMHMMREPSQAEPLLGHSRRSSEVQHSSTEFNGSKNV
ncbi:unnamed protein product [Oikopleura dioica]|uniref:FGF n=1 Tax=Oikopleura dioica TaxID=34765 RepID=E4YXH3_OIKDI|nr:unnamed protein product [Oikopleura dioica]